MLESMFVPIMSRLMSIGQGTGSRTSFRTKKDKAMVVNIVMVVSALLMFGIFGCMGWMVIDMIIDSRIHNLVLKILNYTDRKRAAINDLAAKAQSDAEKEALLQRSKKLVEFVIGFGDQMKTLNRCSFNSFVKLNQLYVEVQKI